MVDGALCTIERRAAAAIAQIGAVNGTNFARLNEHVRKRGRTTELTHGTVRAVFGAYLVPNAGQSVWLTNQVEIVVDKNQSTLLCAGGDSGSLVINDANEAVGLLWASPRIDIGWACDIDTVCTELQVSLFWPIPQISGIVPGGAAAQSQVSILGSGFQLASAVMFGGVASPTFDVRSDSTIVATVPQGIGAVGVTVTAPGGTSLPTPFTYL